MVKLHSMHRAAMWFKNRMRKARPRKGIAASASASPAAQSCPALAPPPLEAFPREIQDRIISYLPLTTLKTLETVSRDVQVLVLANWRREIPPANKAALTAIHAQPCAAAWKQAWLAQCAELGRLGRWGIQASRACKSLPDTLNPFEIESQGCQWIEAETALGNRRAAGILEELFAAILQNKRSLDWRWRRLHSLPPFVSNMNSLQWLFLDDNHLTAVELKDLPALKCLYLLHNHLTTVDLKNLPALRWLNLNNNRLTTVELRGLPALEFVNLNNNHLTAVELRDCELSLLNLDDDQHHLIDSAYRHALPGIPGI